MKDIKDFDIVNFGATDGDVLSIELLVSIIGKLVK